MDFHETLHVLKGWADDETLVDVHVRPAADPAAAPSVLMQGRLETKWHPEMTDPPPAVVFFVGAARWSSFILTREGFRVSSRREDGRLRVTVGGLLLDVGEATLLEAVET